jgi:hypothetical protein
MKRRYQGSGAFSPGGTGREASLANKMGTTGWRAICPHEFLRCCSAVSAASAMNRAVSVSFARRYIGNVRSVPVPNGAEGVSGRITPYGVTTNAPLPLCDSLHWHARISEAFGVRRQPRRGAIAAFACQATGSSNPGNLGLSPDLSRYSRPPVAGTWSTIQSGDGAPAAPRLRRV